MPIDIKTYAIDSILARAERDVTPALRKALYEVANDVLTEAVEIVPFETGALSASGRVEFPEIRKGKVTVAVQFGGPSPSRYVNYAFDQHENETYRHALGRTDHYLSLPIEMLAPTFDVIVADKIRRTLGM